MENHFLKQNDKEFMKMAMLKHEETFKQQVYELHRLYRIQKILMNNSGIQDRVKSKNGLSLDQIENRRVGAMDNDLDESQIELTLGPASYKHRKKDDTPMNSDSGASFSSSSTDSSHVKNREDLGPLDLGQFQVPEMTMRYQNGNRNNVDLDENMRQDRLNHPSWLFQVLSLNMT